MTTPPAAGPVDTGRRLLITLSVMAATLMQVLDTTIVNVALPHMQGELGATTDQISWVLTSYLVSSAILMPLTGYFTDILGRKRYLLIGIAGFVIASALCGLAFSLVQIVGFRLLQGVFGAALVPLSQAIMSDAYPAEERGRAMAIWGMGVMVGPILGPILGPTLGGWLTDVASWRWTFYINVPVGMLSLAMAWRYVPDTPVVRRSMDWIGLAFLASGIAGLQYLLDRGNQQDWFSALDIRWATAAAVLGTALFVLRSLVFKKSLFDIHILADRNFATSCFIMVCLGLGLFGGMVAQPVLIESLLGYPIVTTGLVMAPRGIATAVCMIFVGRIVGRIDARLLVGSGMLVSCAGSMAMTHYSLDIDKFWLIWPIIVQGLGFGLIFVPLSTIAYATLPREKMSEAAGLYSLMRTVGSAMGISVVTTLISRQAQVNWQVLGGHVTLHGGAWSAYAHRLHLDVTSRQAIAVVAGEVAQQAQMIAMIDVFKLTAWSFLALLPLVLLLRGRRSPAADAAVAGVDE